MLRAIAILGLITALVARGLTAQDSARFVGKVTWQLQEDLSLRRDGAFHLRIVFATIQHYPHTGYCLHLRTEPYPAGLIVTFDSVSVCMVGVGFLVSPAYGETVLPWNPGLDGSFTITLKTRSKVDSYMLDSRMGGDWRLISIRPSSPPTFTTPPAYNSWWLVPRNSASIRCVAILLSDNLCPDLFHVARQRLRATAQLTPPDWGSAYLLGAVDTATTTILVARDSQPLIIDSLVAFAAASTGLLDGQDTTLYYKVFVQLDLRAADGTRYSCRNGRCNIVDQ